MIVLLVNATGERSLAMLVLGAHVQVYCVQGKL